MSIPHFAFPFRFTGQGSAQVLEQDDASEIEQNVQVLVLTELGERLEVPEFGVPDPTFRLGLVDTYTIIEAAERWDGRSRVLADSDFGQMIRNVQIHVEEP